MIFNYRKYPKRINLGCGLDKRDGFLNVDMNDCHEPDLVCDVAELSELPSSYYEYAIANDILEHIPRLRTRNVLKEWNRILIIGGILELRVPNVAGVFELLQKKENRTPEAQEKILQCLFGTQSYHGDFHYTGFTDILLKDMLQKTGFETESIQIVDTWLFSVKAKKVADRKVDEIFFLDDEAFIHSVYERYLGRPADAEGFRHYLSLIQSGIVREAIIEAIMTSDEYVQGHQ